MIFYHFCQICVVKSICQHYSESTHSGMTMTSHACMCGGAHDVSLERELPNMLHNTSMRWMTCGASLIVFMFIPLAPASFHVFCWITQFLMNLSICIKTPIYSSINETIKLKYNTRRSIVFISNMKYYGYCCVLCYQYSYLI